MRYALLENMPQMKKQNLFRSETKKHTGLGQDTAKQGSGLIQSV